MKSLGFEREEKKIVGLLCLQSRRPYHGVHGLRQIKQGSDNIETRNIQINKVKIFLSTYMFSVFYFIKSKKDYLL